MYYSGMFGKWINFILFGNEHGTLNIFSHTAQNNFPHAVKTGSILLLLIIGAGFPFVYDHIKKLFEKNISSQYTSKTTSFIDV